jgi:glutamate-1-semialdehyde 2,1-aminomutase
VIEAIKEKVADSTSFGAPTEIEHRLAALICDNIDNIDQIRMTNSGTEATMSAIRVARGYTGKNKVIKFAGNYHGHGDSFLIAAGSGALTLGQPSSPGVTPGTAQDTLVAGYNDLASVEKLLQANSGEVAALIVEPVAGNMGCILPEKGFLEGLRKLCDEHEVVLIFDEVMSGFRLGFGGAQALLGVYADLVTYGKVIGAGLPVGAYGGKRAIMEHVAPLGPVYQAGTLSGNPIAMTAGYTLLKSLFDEPAVYQRLARKTEKLEQSIRPLLEKAGLPHQINRLGSMISLHFTEQPVRDFDSAAAGNNDTFKRFFHLMLEEGVYLPPSPFESWFLNDALSEADLDTTVAAIGQSLNRLG